MRDAELSLIPAAGIALVVVGTAAVMFAFPFPGLSAAASPIATLAMLMVTYVVLVGSADVTRRSQSFYGVPFHGDLLHSAS